MRGKVPLSPTRLNLVLGAPLRLTCLTMAGGRIFLGTWSALVHSEEEVRLSPVVLRSGPYRLYFYSHEPNEPAHVHVDRDDCSAKLWLEPVSLAYNLGFSARELRRIEEIVTQNRTLLREAWRGYFGT